MGINWLAYLYPLHKNIWMAVLVCIATAIVVLNIINYIQTPSMYEGSFFLVYDVFQVFCAQGKLLCLM